jgi:hypothetical protein
MKKFPRVFKYVLFVGFLASLASLLQAQDTVQSTAPDRDHTRIPVIRNPPQSAPSFTLTLSAGLRNRNISEFRVGSTVWITIVQKNITSHTIGCSGWYSDTGDMSYSFDVRDEDGKPVEKVVHPHPELDMPKYFSFGIRAGESNTDEVELNNGYKFDRPGKYVIQVSHPDNDFKDDKGNPAVVKSDTITITVTG